MSRVLRFGFLATAAIAMVAGCADERPPRSFVQPNIIKKGDLTGTWYYIQTVSEAPPTNGSSFVGQSSSLLKIKFDVQEDYLYARRAYEQVEGSEDQAQKDPANYKGAPLAAWRISSQFDIIRDFNSTTGEQTNKVIESTERPWNQREFIRVDWSQNLVTDYVGLGLDFFFSDGQPRVEPVSYWESNPASPDALHIERNSDANHPEGFLSNEMTYLDITNQVLLTPEALTAQYEENGQTHTFSYPKCFFGYEQDDCATQRIKIRHAFAKLPPICGQIASVGKTCSSDAECDGGSSCTGGACVATGRCHDYEPRMWDGKQMELFGVWDVGLRRLTYNRDYGITNTGFDRHAARFNVWQHAYQPDGKTLIAPAMRQHKQIAYYAEGSMPITYTNDPVYPEGYTDSIFPPSLWPQFAEIVKEWDDAMKVAVADAQGMDVTKISPDDHVFVACHSPVWLKGSGHTDKSGKEVVDADVCLQGLVPDHDAAGNIVYDKANNPIYHARAGDPRHSCVYWVNQEQNAGPLGYGPPLYDETTGETISGQAYIYGAALDTYTARSRDLMLLSNGEITSEDFTAGTNVQDWVNQHRFGTSSATQTREPEEVLAMSRSMDFNFAKAFSPTNGYPALDLSSNRTIRPSINARMQLIGQNFFSYHTPDRNLRLSRIVGTPLERMMMSTEMLAVAGVSPAKSWDQLSVGEKIKASPFRRQTTMINGVPVDVLNDRQRVSMEMRGVDFDQFGDEGVSQRLAVYLKQYGAVLAPHSEEIKQQMRGDIFLAVTLHEVGHNMGCRHNFRGSYDSMNYFKDYWKIRTDAVNMPDPGMKAGDGKLHPRYINKPGGVMSQYEKDSSIREYQYSSIMDYGAEFNSDLKGLGLYDKAFIKFSYAQFVEVFTDAKTDADTQAKIGSLHQFQNALGFPSPLGPGAGLTAIPYHQYPDLFNSGSDGIYMRKDIPFASISDKPIGQTGSTIKTDDDGNPLVPYYFCSDEFAGNLTCQRFDAGADTYEQISDQVSRYKNFYLYNNFKRDRQSFHSSAGYVSRIKARYFEPIREALTWYVLLRTDFQSFLTDNAALGFGKPEQVIEQENKFFTDENGWGNFTVAVAMGFDTIGQVLTTPSAGWHFKKTSADGTALWSQFRDDTTPISDPRIKSVGLLNGKYLNTTWDFSGCGYYWAEECQTRVGYMIDKTIALDVLSDSQAYFTGRDTNADVRQYAIGYIIPFKNQIEEKLGALFAGDNQSFAPYFKRVQGEDVPVQPSWTMDDPTVVKKDVLDPQASFTLSLYAGVYGLSAFPTTFDHDIIDNTKIFVVGNGEASTSDADILANGTSDPAQLVAHGGSKQWYVATDPTSGKTFAAHSSPMRSSLVLDVNSTDKGNQYQTRTVGLRGDIGVRMLEHVQSLGGSYNNIAALPDSDVTKVAKLAQAQIDLNNFRENIEVMRSLHNAFGYGPYRTDAPFYY